MKNRWMFLLCTVLLSGCITRIGDMTVASTKNMDIKSAHYRVDTHQRVMGRDTVHIVSFVPTALFPNLKEAMDNAIEQAPGAVALSDMTIKRGWWWIPMIYGRDYIEVEGNPVYEEETGAAASTGSGYTAGTAGAGVSRDQWQAQQLQQLMNERGLSYEEFQRRYRAITGQ